MAECTCRSCGKSFTYRPSDVREAPREHRLLCGDSTTADDVGRVREGEKALVMNTDPPYGVNVRTVGRNASKNGMPGSRTMVLMARNFKPSLSPRSARSFPTW